MFTLLEITPSVVNSIADLGIALLGSIFYIIVMLNASFMFPRKNKNMVYSSITTCVILALELVFVFIKDLNVPPLIAHFFIMSECILGGLAGYFWVRHVLTEFILNVTFKKSLIALIPLGVVVILLIANIFVPFLYTLDPWYKAEPFGFLPYLIEFGYFVLAEIICLLFIRKNTWKNISYHFVFIIILVATISQIVFPTLLATWASLAIAYFVVFMINILNYSNRDSLTLLLNKRSYYNRTVMYSKRVANSNSQLTAITFNINDFKQINDELGHKEGDEVLIRFSGLLTSAVKGIDDCDVFRVGGNEFVILMLSKSDDITIEKNLILKIRYNLKWLNESNNGKYNLNVNINIVKTKGTFNADEFVQKIGEILYANKARQLAKEEKENALD